MPQDKYRITRATVAMFMEGDHHIAHIVMEGSVVLIDPETFNGDKLVKALWAEKPVMMFAHDLRSRAKKIT